MDLREQGFAKIIYTWKKLLNQEKGGSLFHTNTHNEILYVRDMYTYVHTWGCEYRDWSQKPCQIVEEFKFKFIKLFFWFYKRMFELE